MLGHNEENRNKLAGTLHTLAEAYTTLAEAIEDDDSLAVAQQAFEIDALQNQLTAEVIAKVMTTIFDVTHSGATDEHAEQEAPGAEDANASGETLEDSGAVPARD